jgi:hypothetical protein
MQQAVRDALIGFMAATAQAHRLRRRRPLSGPVSSTPRSTATGRTLAPPPIAEDAHVTPGAPRSTEGHPTPPMPTIVAPRCARATNSGAGCPFDALARHQRPPVSRGFMRHHGSASGCRWPARCRWKPQDHRAARVSA